MGMLIFWLLILVGIYFFIKKTDAGIAMLLPPIAKAAYKSRTAEQKRVIRYFALPDTFGGIFSIGEMSDVEYEAYLKSYLENTNFKKKALDKFDLDADEITEVKPFKLENYYYDKDKTVWKRGKDGKCRSSAYQVSWVFATSDKFYMYSLAFWLDADTKREVAEETFWKDIVKFSTTSEAEEISKIVGKQKNGTPIYQTQTIDVNKFIMLVSGDKFECVTDGSDATESSIKGLRTKLDEKKKG